MGGEGSPEALAGYLAGYVVKGTEEAHGLDVPVTHPSAIEDSGRTEHVRALMRAAWSLGKVAGLEDLGLRRWCHMLGYRGRVLTASRGFSVTFRALQAARAAYCAEKSGKAAESAVWSYAGQDWGDPNLERYAGQVREDIAENRELAREAENDRRIEEERWSWAGPE